MGEVNGSLWYFRHLIPWIKRRILLWMGYGYTLTPLSHAIGYEIGNFFRRLASREFYHNIEYRIVPGQAQLAPCLAWERYRKWAEWAQYYYWITFISTRYEVKRPDETWDEWWARR